MNIPHELSEYIQDVHYEAARLLYILTAIDHLDEVGAESDEVVTLLSIAREKADALRTSLDSVNLPGGRANV